MNVTEFVYLTSDIIRYHLFKETPVYRFITRVLAFALKKTWTLFVKLSLGGWILIKDVTHLGLIFACILLFYLLFSFIRSLQPRYKFCNLDKDELQKPDEKDCTNGPQYYCIICENLPKRRLWREELMTKLKSEYIKVEKDCRLAMTLDDIQDVYGRLSWSQTQIDFESVNWLNQTLQTFWPSIKTMLDKFLIKSLVKPKPRLQSCEIKNLVSNQPKLSVYISSRRKLELLKTSTTNWLTKAKRYIDQSAVAIIILFARIFLIYFKQFIMDYVRYMISNSDSRQKERQFNLNLKKFLTEKSLEKEGNKKGSSSNMFAPRTWAGFDLRSGRRRKSNGLLENRRKRKFRSAESAPRVFFAKNGLTSMEKLRKKRLKLAAIYCKHTQDPFIKKELIIEKVRLGNTLPTVTGIKAIEENSICLLNGVNKVSRHLAPSDDSNMKYVVELNYQTDNKFCIQLTSVPILNRIRLTSLGFRLRLLLNLNHTTSELNRDLKIFDTPGDILWPAINYAQVALVDVPVLDWNIERLFIKPKTVKGKTTPTRQEHKFLQLLVDKYSKYLDPVNLINHLYFKYLIHLALYLGLKWFQAFDIKIGKHLYLKSLC